MNANVRVTGVKETINTLNRMDKALGKELRKDVEEIVTPVREDVQAAYRRIGVPISNMAYKWGSTNRAGNTRNVFPYVPARATTALKVTHTTRRGSIGVIGITQMNPAGAIFEVAGRKNHNRLSASLNYMSGRGWYVGKPSRILGPVMYRSARGRQVTEKVVQLVERVSAQLNIKLQRVA